MKPVTFNYNPKVALQAIDAMVEKNQADKESTEQQKKVFEDIKTLAHLGAQCLSKEPISGPAIRETTKNNRNGK